MLATLVPVPHLNTETPVRATAEPRLESERLPLGVEVAHDGLAAINDDLLARDARVLGLLGRAGFSGVRFKVRLPNRHSKRVVDLGCAVNHKERIRRQRNILDVEVLSGKVELEHLSVAGAHRQRLDSVNVQHAGVFVERTTTLLHVDQLYGRANLRGQLLQRRACLTDEVVLAVLVPVIDLYHDPCVHSAARHCVDLERFPLGVDCLHVHAALASDGVRGAAFNHEERVRCGSERSDVHAVLCFDFLGVAGDLEARRSRNERLDGDCSGGARNRDNTGDGDGANGNTGHRNCCNSWILHLLQSLIRMEKRERGKRKMIKILKKLKINT